MLVASFSRMRMPLSPCRVALAMALSLPAGCAQDNPPLPSQNHARTANPARAYPDIEAERAAVVRAFVGYRTAIVAQRGDEALRFTSEKTTSYYERMRIAALDMPEAELRRAPLMDKLVVLGFRARATQAELEASNGKDLFAMAIDRGWTGDDVAKLEAGEVRIDGDTARLGVRKGDSVLPAAAGFLAYREGSEWKLDVMSIQKMAETALRPMLEKISADENEALVQVMSLLVHKDLADHKDLTDEIWQPLRKPK